MADLRTGGEWVVEVLRAEGVRHVFGLPGVHNLAIYDALIRQHDIAHILSRHEQGSGFMADGYARASGRPGVVVVTTGPGATNVLTPLVESFAGSQPILVLNPEDDLHVYTSRIGPYFKNGKVHDLPGWNHGFLDAKTEEAAAIVRGFLKGN